MRNNLSDPPSSFLAFRMCVISWAFGRALDSLDFPQDGISRISRPSICPAGVRCVGFIKTCTTTTRLTHIEEKLVSLCNVHRMYIYVYTQGGGPAHIKDCASQIVVINNIVVLTIFEHSNFMFPWEGGLVIISIHSDAIFQGASNGAHISRVDSWFRILCLLPLLLSHATSLWLFWL